MIDNDLKILKKYNNKKVNAKKRGLKVLLSFEEYKQLLLDVNITSDQIGRDSDKYNLSRYNDSGDYELGNCRFITHKENMLEKKPSKITDKMIKASRENIKNYNNIPITEERRKILQENGRNGENHYQKNI